MGVTEAQAATLFGSTRDHGPSESHVSIKETKALVLRAIQRVVGRELDVLVHNLAGGLVCKVCAAEKWTVRMLMRKVVRAAKTSRKDLRILAGTRVLQATDLLKNIPRTNEKAYVSLLRVNRHAINMDTYVERVLAKLAASPQRAEMTSRIEKLEQTMFTAVRLRKHLRVYCGLDATDVADYFKTVRAKWCPPQANI